MDTNCQIIFHNIEKVIENHFSFFHNFFLILIPNKWWIYRYMFEQCNALNNYEGKILPAKFYSWQHLLLHILYFFSTVMEATIKDVRIFCNSNDIVVSIEASAKFNGMIYPKGLSKNSSCMAEFKSQINPVLYKLPLKSCNTMSTELVSWILTLYGLNYHIWSLRIEVFLSMSYYECAIMS